MMHRLIRLNHYPQSAQPLTRKTQPPSQLTIQLSLPNKNILILFHDIFWLPITRQYNMRHRHLPRISRLQPPRMYLSRRLERRALDTRQHHYFSSPAETESAPALYFRPLHSISSVLS